MSEIEALVKAYLDAFSRREFDLARNFLSDRGFSYISPIGRYQDADHFIQNISRVGPILERMVIRKCMTSGNEAIAIMDSTLAMSGYKSYAVAMLFAVHEGRIKSIEAIYDASDYHRLFLNEDSGTE
jgi:hypothetical protein